MEPVRVVWGVGTAATAVASYDTALAEANLHDYNLLQVSSVLPEGAAVEAVGRAPDLGPAGGLIPVVQARVTAREPAELTAGLGWVVTEGGSGVVYEAAGETDEVTIRDRIRSGLTEAADLRDWTPLDPEIKTVSATAASDGFTTAVVLAVYGRPDPIL
jgi:arginine decarboxylase